MKPEVKGRPWLIARRHGLILMQDFPQQQPRPSLLWDLAIIVLTILVVALGRIVVGRAFPS